MTIEELAEKLGIELTDETTASINEFAAAEVAALKANNKALKDEKRGLAEKLEALKGLDLEAVADALGRESDDVELDELPELIAALKEKQKPADPDDPPKDDPRVAELERKLERVTKKADEKVAEAEAKIATLNGAIGNGAVSAEAAQAIAAAEGSVKGLMPHVKGRVKAEVDDDGEVSLTILAPNGETMEDDKGNPATMKHLVDELRRDDDLSGLFKEPAGGSETKRTGNFTTTKKFAEMNLDDRSKLKRENPALYSRLKGEAA